MPLVLSALDISDENRHNAPLGTASKAPALKAGKALKAAKALKAGKALKDALS